MPLIAIGQVLVHNRHSYSLSLTTFGTPHPALPGRHSVQASTVAGVGAVITTGAGLVTVNVAVAVLVSHLSVAVNVTVTLPPVHR